MSKTANDFDREIISNFTAVNAELLKTAALIQGQQFTPKLAADILREARTSAVTALVEFRNVGVPQVFQALFNLRRKKAVEKFCEQMVIEKGQFANLVFNHQLLGYRHARHHCEIRGQHLTPTPNEEKAFCANGVGSLRSAEAKAFLRKINATFKERKNINAHLFSRDDEWHLFYFTFDDVNASAKGIKPHWKAGDHVHYISNLWNADLRSIWNEIITTGKRRFGGCHIRYRGLLNHKQSTQL